MKTVRKDDADLRRRKWRFPVCCTSRKNVTAAECAKNRWDGRKHGALRRRDEPDRPAEAKGEFETMTQKDKQALLRVRSQARLVQELRERPDKRMLFSVTKNATKAQVEAIVRMIEEMQQGQ